jgi:hypothetical protein
MLCWSLKNAGNSDADPLLSVMPEAAFQKSSLLGRFTFTMKKMRIFPEHK